MNSELKSARLPTEVVHHLSEIFRHMLPGILVIGGAKIAYPKFHIDLTSWQNVFVLAAISLAVGNTWFSLNRYGVHQIADYVFYLFKSDGPARKDTKWVYVDDLGQYTCESLHAPETSSRAQRHVSFRASTVLLILTVGELLLVFAYWHAKCSFFARHRCAMNIGGVLSLAVGFWQMFITRRIDYYVVVRSHKT
jgi:hypothetical protein